MKIPIVHSISISLNPLSNIRVPKYEFQNEIEKRVNSRWRYEPIRGYVCRQTMNGVGEGMVRTFQRPLSWYEDKSIGSPPYERRLWDLVLYLSVASTLVSERGPDKRAMQVTKLSCKTPTLPRDSIGGQIRCKDVYIYFACSRRFFSCYRAPEKFFEILNRPAYIPKKVQFHKSRSDSQLEVR